MDIGHLFNVKVRISSYPRTWSSEALEA